MLWGYCVAVAALSVVLAARFGGASIMTVRVEVEVSFIPSVATGSVGSWPDQNRARLERLPHRKQGIVYVMGVKVLGFSPKGAPECPPQPKVP
jgi:hypothetical protein